tara:strand:- start:260 stop:523 length:264 start_codon:yes stop_codon:yes gene_type:complete
MNTQNKNYYEFIINLYIFIFSNFFWNFFKHLAKNADGFTKFIPSFESIITIILCKHCLSQVMKTISALYTYATFAGLCIIATTILEL